MNKNVAFIGTVVLLSAGCSTLERPDAVELSQPPITVATPQTFSCAYDAAKPKQCEQCREAAIYAIKAQYDSAFHATVRSMAHTAAKPGEPQDGALLDVLATTATVLAGDDSDKADIQIGATFLRGLMNWFRPEGDDDDLTTAGVIYAMENGRRAAMARVEANLGKSCVHYPMSAAIADLEKYHDAGTEAMAKLP